MFFIVILFFIKVFGVMINNLMVFLKVRFWSFEFELDFGFGIFGVVGRLWVCYGGGVFFRFG